MLRNLKALGLALGAVFAMGAMSASSASAVTDVFTVTGGGTAIATGVSTHQVGATHTSDRLTMTGSNKDFTCTQSKYAATVTNGDTHVTVDATYTGKLTETPHNTVHKCNSAIGDLTITMNECDFDLTGTTTGHDPVGTPDATIWITCGAKPIEMDAPAGVIIKIPAQTPTTGGVTYTNLPNHPGGAAITFNATATGITYTCAPAFACGLGGIATHGTDADYNGHTIVTCWTDTEGLPTPVTEGPQRGCSIS
jgi:hypothetical protein